MSSSPPQSPPQLGLAQRSPTGYERSWRNHYQIHNLINPISQMNGKSLHPRYSPTINPLFISPLLPHFSSLRHHQPQPEPLNLPHRILETLQQCRNPRHLSQIHALFITSGYTWKPFFAAKLLNLTAEIGDLNYTLTMFRNLGFLNRICVNAVIRAYSGSSVAIQGVAFYFQMVKVGFLATSFTFPPLLSCCARFGCAMSGQKCHGQAIKKGFDGVVEIKNCLIHMYGCFGMVDVAVYVFDEMPERDLVSWNSVIGALFNGGDARSAHRLFDEMPERDLVSWNVMMTGYLDNNMPGFVLKLFRQMVNAGFVGDAKSIVSVLTACGRSARLKEGMSVHGFLIRRKCSMNLIISTAMIDMYSKCRKVEAARRIFDGLPEKNLICWNSMILGYCFHGNPHHGLDLFADMEEKTGDNARGRVIPDAITFIGVLCACSRLSLLGEGKEYFDQLANKFGIKPNFGHYWCMANLLASNGRVEEALETVRKVNEFNGDLSSESVIWATLLGLCRFQGCTSLGERVAKSLIQLEPENIMCYALLFNVYAAGGRWDAVSILKEAIRERFARRMLGCSLIDLIEIVHKFTLTKPNGEGGEMVMSLNELLQRQDLSCILPPHSRSLKFSDVKLGSEG